MSSATLKNEQQCILKCWGEDIKGGEIKTKKYLSYIIRKENFDSIKKYVINSKVDLKRFDYVEVIYDQLSHKTTFDFNSETGEEDIVETNLGLYISIK